MNNEINAPQKTDRAGQWRDIIILVLTVLLIISLSLLVVNKYIIVNGGFETFLIHCS